MAEELISSYIDRASIQADTDFFISNIRNVYEQFQKLSGFKVEMNSAKSSKDFVDSLKKVNVELEKSIKLNSAEAKAALDRERATVQSTKAKTEEAKARKINAEAAEKEAKAQQIAAKEAANEEKALRAKQKEIEEAANAYKKLSKEYNEAALKAKNYALTLGESNPITIEAVKQAKDMYAVLYRLDQAVGQNQRNVGNYKSAFDGLGMSFAQVSRELPSLGISVQQFALAISNNLPMVADEIAKAKNEIAALKAEGKDAPSLFQRIGGSLLSWQVGLSVAIALLTTLGPKLVDWVKGMLDGSKATRDAAREQTGFNEAQKRTIELQKEYNSLRGRASGTNFRNVENELEYLRARGAAEDEILKKEKELLGLRKEAAATPFFGSGGEAELARLGTALEQAKTKLLEFENTGVYSENGIFGSGKRLKAGDEAYDILKKQLDSEFDLLRLKYADQKKIVEDFYNANREFNAKDLEIQRFYAEQREKVFTGEMEYRAEALAELSKAETLRVDQSIELRKEAFKIQKQIIEIQRAEELAGAKGNKADIKFINQKFDFEQLQLLDKFEADKLAIRSSYAAREKEFVKTTNDEFDAQETARSEKAVQDAIAERDKRINILNESRAIELAALERKYAERQVTEEQYQKESLRLEVKYNADILREEIAFTEAVIAAAKLRGEEVAEEERKLAEFKLKLARETNKELKKENKDAAKEAKKDLEDMLDAMDKIARELVNLLQSIGAGVFVNQKNALQEQIDLLEERKQKDIEAANISIQNEQDKAAAISTINARAAAQREALERKQREVDQQKARFDRAAAVARVIQETGIQIIKNFGTPLALLAGILGAVQVATILAQPIPKYRFGRNAGPAEFAIVGDGGVPEVVEKADGRAYLTPSRDTLTWLEKGDRVHPSVDKFLNTAGKLNRADTAPLQPLPAVDVAAILSGEIKHLGRVISNKRENYIALKNGEFRRSVKTSAGWTHYVNSNVYN